MRVAITGADGFLGWHVRVLMRALRWPEPVVLTRADLAEPSAAAEKLDGVDRVLHLAGANRGTPADVAATNVSVASALAKALRLCATPPTSVAYANSIHAGDGTPYGDSKATGAELLRAAAGHRLEDLRLPNLYGEHGRPFYNSVVATFCEVLARGGQPEIQVDRQLDLAHVTDAAARLLGLPAGDTFDASMPIWRTDVRALAAKLAAFAAIYRGADVPPLATRHDVRLFNTYRSFCFPTQYPLFVTRRADRRGELVEVVKSGGGGGQTFCSTSHPGITRGDHFHLAKVERFAVLRGTAEICLRRIGHTDTVRFAVSGDEPAVVDMPTMWAHSITNVGSGELLTMFWTNEVFDPERPDTYPEPVEDRSAAPAMV